MTEQVREWCSLICLFFFTKKVHFCPLSAYKPFDLPLSACAPAWYPVRCLRGECDSEATRKEDLFQDQDKPTTGDGANDDNGGTGDLTAAGENTIRVLDTSLGWLIGGALIIPLISALMGSLGR